MANYDITMKQYNGSGYDSLYPKDIGQQVLLNDSSLRSLLGITTSNPSINDAIAQLNTNAENSIEMGSYVGTGQYGSTHPNSLSFSFNPRFVYIMGWNSGAFIKEAPWGVITEFSSSSDLMPVTWGNKTMSWYNGTSELQQLNHENDTYYYIAFK